MSCLPQAVISAVCLKYYLKKKKNEKRIVRNSKIHNKNRKDFFNTLYINLTNHILDINICIDRQQKFHQKTVKFIIKTEKIFYKHIINLTNHILSINICIDRQQKFHQKTVKFIIKTEKIFYKYKPHLGYQHLH